MRAVRTPFIRLARNGSTLPDNAFTAPGGVGAAVADQLSDDLVFTHFDDGATIVLQGLHRLWPPLIDFGQQLAADLGHPVQINAYVTPPGNRGFSDHYDVHDVFVVQVSGRKRWQVRPPVLAAPLRTQPWTDHRDKVAAAAREPALFETTMEPGTVLYLPRGYLHAATALGSTSIHLTIGIHPWTRHHLAAEITRQALAALTREEHARTALPVGVDLGDTEALAPAVEAARRSVLAAVAGVDPAALGEAMSGKAQTAQRAEPLSPLAQHVAVATLSQEQQVRARRHLAARWEAGPAGADVELITRAGRLALSGEDVETTKVFLKGQAWTAGELGLDLAVRLLRAGVAVPLP